MSDKVDQVDVNNHVQPTEGLVRRGCKREDFLEWPEYFMAIAFLSAMRSKDPASQVGACIVNSDNKIVGIGYNGMPIGCSDDVLPWGKESPDKLENKYMYVCHAEMNAILNKNSSDVKGCIIYVALFPCNECAKIIIQSQIKEVVYFSDKHAHKVETVAAKRLFDYAGITYRQFTPKHGKILIDFDAINGSGGGTETVDSLTDDMGNVPA